MSPKCSTPFSEASRKLKTAKMHPKTCPKTMAIHSQREHLYMYSFGQRTHPESDSEPVNARFREVNFLMLFTMVLKTSAFERERQKINPKPKKHVKAYPENLAKMT